MISLHTAMNNGVADEDYLLTVLQNDIKAANNKNAYGHYPLYYACQHKKYHHRLVLKLLVAYPEAIIDEWKNKTTNPLHIVCSCHDKPDLVSLILENNPMLLNVVNEKEQTPLQLACIRQCHNIIDVLLMRERLDVNSTDIFGCTALHYADYVTTETLLFRESINVNVLNKEGETSFITFVKSIDSTIQRIAIARNKQLETIKMYMRQFPSVLNWRHPYTGNNLLHVIIEMKILDILKTVMPYIDHILNDRNSSGKTPLHLALRKKSTCDLIINMLLEKPGIELNLQCNKGNTVLHNACCHFNTDQVRKLLTSDKMNLKLYNKNGDNPLHAMLKSLNDAKKKKFRKNPFTFKSPMTMNAMMASEIIRLFLDHDKRIIFYHNVNCHTIHDILTSVIDRFKRFGFTECFGYRNLTELKTNIEVMIQQERWMLYTYVKNEHEERLTKKQKIK
jgi:ankyrin repeat protein